MGVPGVLEPVFLQDFRPLNHDTKMFDELGFSATLANVSVTPDPAQGWDLGGRLIRRQTDLLTHPGRRSNRRSVPAGRSNLPGDGRSAPRRGT